MENNYETLWNKLKIEIEEKLDEKKKFLKQSEEDGSSINVLYGIEVAIFNIQEIKLEMLFMERNNI